MRTLLVLAVPLLVACAERYYASEIGSATQAEWCSTQGQATALGRLDWHGLAINSRVFQNPFDGHVHFQIYVKNRTDQVVHLESDLFMVSVDGAPERPVKITTAFRRYRIPATFPLKGENVSWIGDIDQDEADTLRVRAPALLLNGKPTSLPVFTFKPKSQTLPSNC